MIYRLALYVTNVVSHVFVLVTKYNWCVDSTPATIRNVKYMIPRRDVRANIQFSIPLSRLVSGLKKSASSQLAQPLMSPGI